jgi:hypothetical protein
MYHFLLKIIFAVMIFAAGIYTATFIDSINGAYTSLRHNPQTHPLPTKPAAIDISFPETLTLCGEAVPLEDRRVWEMLDREFHITVWNRAQVYMYLKRATRYFPFIESKLAEAGLPDDLKFLAVAESALLTYSLSKKGAKGPWQFMTLAARSNGLRRDGIIDERLSFERSTEAALKNLTRLYDTFGTWALAMAAYNSGETRVRKAIKKQGTNDYYRLNLPLETERYVFRIAAIKIVIENHRRYGYELSPAQAYRPERNDAVEVKLRRTVDLAGLARAIGTDYKDIKERNPQFLRDYIPTGLHRVLVPVGSGMKTVDYLKSKSDTAARVALVSSDREPIDIH